LATEAPIELTEQQIKDGEQEKKNLRAAFAGYWATDKNIVLPGGDKFTFQDHEYLYKSLMRMPHKSKDKQPQIRVKKKGTQTGGSISKVIECFHYGIYGIVKGIGYVMPSDPEVQAFGKTKFAPMIQLNPDAIGKYVKSGGKGTDSAELKKVGETFIHFKSASANKQIEGENTSSTATSFSCDVLVFDEYDMMDPVIANKFLGRIDHSDYKIVEYLSNPTLENFGIDALFSSQTNSIGIGCVRSVLDSPVQTLILSMECLKNQSNAMSAGTAILPVVIVGNNCRFITGTARQNSNPIGLHSIPERLLRVKIIPT
jgi:hypothetical protein